MLHSLAAQTDYYSNLIMDHNGWRFAGIYAAEAYSGTKEQRPEFQRMLTDCRKGLIEYAVRYSPHWNPVLSAKTFRCGRPSGRLLSARRRR